MELGLHLPNSGPLSGKSNLVDLARHAEEIGLDTVWVFDHVFNPVAIGPKSKFPGGAYYNQPEMPYFESMTTLSVVAGATSRIKLGTRVLIAVYRNPVLLAKQIGTLVALAGDRFILGVGAGWLLEEFETMGVPPEARFERLDEHVALMRQAWREEISEFNGKHYRHIAAGFRPVPGERVPVIVGGNSEGALRRAARWGDGWAPSGPSVGDDTRDKGQELIDRFRRACELEDRDPSSLLLVASGPLAAGPSHFETLAELGFDMCDISLRDEADLDLAALEKFMVEVAPNLR
ncbi:MAG: TIGR03619 family F420-dependent LLM class oxidoreductase [Acidimicrobiales bacterium]|nr:TIGR03619 family F420-dependent LLM class oxidoreductase [Acidimicrobiales bacterium]